MTVSDNPYSAPPPQPTAPAVPAIRSLTPFQAFNARKKMQDAANAPHPVPQQMDPPQAAWYEEYVPELTALSAIGYGGYSAMKAYVFDNDDAQLRLHYYGQDYQRWVRQTLNGYARRRGEL